MNCNRFSVLNEMIPIILEEILTMLKAGETKQLIGYLDDLSLSNEMIKEHLIGLSLNKGIQAQFDKIDTRVKTAFTKEYNKLHKDITRVAGGKKVVEAHGPEESSDEEDDEEEQEVLLDENEMKEIQKAKREEKAKRKAAAAMKRLGATQELTMI